MIYVVYDSRAGELAAWTIVVAARSVVVPIKVPKKSSLTVGVHENAGGTGDTE